MWTTRREKIFRRDAFFCSSRNCGDEPIRIPTLCVGSLSHWGRQHGGALHAPVRRPIPQANASFAFKPEAIMRYTSSARPPRACRAGGSGDPRDSVKNLFLRLIQLSRTEERGHEPQRACPSLSFSLMQFHAIGPTRQMPGGGGQRPNAPGSTQEPDKPYLISTVPSEPTQFSCLPPSEAGTNGADSNDQNGLSGVRQRFGHLSFML